MKNFAFAWRSAEGLPSGRDLPPNSVENVLIRVSGSVVLAKLGGEYWATGEMRANRCDLLAAWSPDSRAVIEVANSRWETDSFVHYLLEGATVAKVDPHALVEPVMKARLPKAKCEINSFRVRADLPVTLDARGHARFTAMVYVPKGENQPGLRSAGRYRGEQRQAGGADRFDAAGKVRLGQACR